MDLNKFKLETKYITYNRIFLLSDVHLGTRANSLEWIQNIECFFNNFYITYLKQNIRPNDVLFILGDIFDHRQLIDINVLNVGVNIMSEISKLIPIYIFPGNHDAYRKYDTNVNSVIAFKNMLNVTIFEKPVIVTNNKSKILILPWIGNKETEENYVRANKFDYIFAHTEMSGFKYDNGRDIKDSIGSNFDKFKGIKRLFSGHIHKRQEKDNLIYIGSPYHTKRSDIGNVKGLYIFDTENNTYTFTVNDYSPIFQRIMLESILELTLEETLKLLENNYTDIIVPEKYIHLFSLTKFLDILKDCKYKKIETFPEKKKFENEFSNLLSDTDVKDILTMLEISIDEMNYQDETIIKLKTLNRRYYENSSKEEI